MAEILARLWDLPGADPFMSASSSAWPSIPAWWHHTERGGVGQLGHNAVVLLRELVQTSEAVAATSGRTAKITEIAALLRRASSGEVPAVVAFLSGELLQRQIGVGYASLGELLRLEPSGQPPAGPWAVPVAGQAPAAAAPASGDPLAGAVTEEAAPGGGPLTVA